MYRSIAVLVKSYFIKNQALYTEQTCTYGVPTTIHFTINSFFFSKVIMCSTKNLLHNEIIMRKCIQIELPCTNSIFTYLIYYAEHLRWGLKITGKISQALKLTHYTKQKQLKAVFMRHFFPPFHTPSTVLKNIKSVRFIATAHGLATSIWIAALLVAS